MIRLARRTMTTLDEPPGFVAYAAEFASVVERSFQIDDSAIDRVRGRVLGAFIEAAPAPSRPRLDRPVRRGLALSVAATIGLLAFGSAAVQAQPGGPFYPIKLAIETATLPSVEVPAGWAARLDRLQLRIDEGLAGARARDPRAIAVALTEYRAEMITLSAGLADATRRATLAVVLSRDLPNVLSLEQPYPSEAATLLVADIRTILRPIAPGRVDSDPSRGGSDHGMGPTDPADDQTEHPHRGVDQIGNPHAAGSPTGNPHVPGSTGNPHAPGSTGDPHPAADTTGNPHPPGSTGNSHAPRSTANPHASGSTGKPHGGADPRAKH